MHNRACCKNEMRLTVHDDYVVLEENNSQDSRSHAQQTTFRLSVEVAGKIREVVEADITCLNVS